MAGRQLPLNLPVDASLAREDFLVSPSNEPAYAFIERWPDWPDRRGLVVGPAGSGKSHLAAIWAARSGAMVRAAGALEESDVPTLVGTGAVVVEDADRAVGREVALFHLLNLARETAASVLLTARASPGLWGLGTPDLLSRLRALPTVEIDVPDDALLRSLLVKLFVDRQLIVDTTIVDYLARHLDRSFAAARTAVAALDREALSRGKRITRSMASEVIDAGDADASDT